MVKVTNSLLMVMCIQDPLFTAREREKAPAALNLEPFTQVNGKMTVLKAMVFSILNVVRQVNMR